MRTTTIKVATADMQPQLLAITHLAFAADPFFRWIMPSPQSYIESYAKITHAMAGKAFDCGSAYYTDDYSCAALWLPPGVEADEALLAATLMDVVPESIAENMIRLGDEVEKYHPDHCWYLAVIGVDVAKQGQGLGAAMLKHALRRCDEDGVVAYLESSNPANVSLYQRHGFEVMGEILVGNPEPLTPMIRQPRTER
ncbi:MAG: GNAT superfamily N-acetyltransferase [Paraglaciecola psychrophila]|jgi:GNAT superfamily N-acetyltransferase